MDRSRYCPFRQPDFFAQVIAMHFMVKRTPNADMTVDTCAGTLLRDRAQRGISHPPPG
jgi:hypothetical protein